MIITRFSLTSIVSPIATWIGSSTDLLRLGWFLPLVLTCFWSQLAQAEAMITLTDGSMLRATIKEIRSGEVTVSTSFASNLTIASHLISDIDVDHEAQETSVLLLDDGRRVEASPLLVSSGALALTSGEVIKLAQIDVLNPEPWEMGQGYAWEGLASAAFTVNRGNSDKDQLDFSVNTQFDSTRDRITLRANVEQDTAIVSVQTDVDGETRTVQSREPAADNWRVVAKYDYYLEDWTTHYLGINASVEADKFADINLRSYLGPYYGRKLFDGGWGKLDAELGLVRVETDFLNAEDTDYLGANWNFTGESKALGGGSRVYLTHVGIVNLSDDNSLLLNTTLGFGFPFLFGLDAAAEFKVDYDGAAAVGKESVDQSYNLRVGYSW